MRPTCGAGDPATGRGLSPKASGGTVLIGDFMEVLRVFYGSLMEVFRGHKNMPGGRVLYPDLVLYLCWLLYPPAKGLPRWITRLKIYVAWVTLRRQKTGCPIAPRRELPLQNNFRGGLPRVESTIRVCVPCCVRDCRPRAHPPTDPPAAADHGWT